MKLRTLNFLALLAVAMFTSIPVAAQEAKAAADYYPLGYGGDTWIGKVIAFDNEQRTLTLTVTGGKKTETFVAVIPDAPYEWTGSYNQSVLDFPFDTKATSQVFKYASFADTDVPAVTMPDSGGGMKRRANPPDTNRIKDLRVFKGKEITVYYTPRERLVNGVKGKYNDVWRIRF